MGKLQTKNNRVLDSTLLHNISLRLDKRLFDFKLRYKISNICVLSTLIQVIELFLNWSTASRQLHDYLHDINKCWERIYIVSSPSFLGNDCFFLITWRIENTEVKNVKKFVILINVEKQFCGGFYNWMLSGQKQSSEGKCLKIWLSAFVILCVVTLTKNIVLLHLQSATKNNCTLSLFTPFSFRGPRRHTG